MDKTTSRFERNVQAFGAQGQKKISNLHVVILGVGGLGSHVVQQLGYLGVSSFTLIDPDELEESNRNRLIGAREDDRIPGTPKVFIGKRLLKDISSEIYVDILQEDAVSYGSFEKIIQADWAFGCFDHDGPRSIVNELCAAYSIPYIDLASGIPEPSNFGGRVCLSLGDNGCLECFGEIDQDEVTEFLSLDRDKEVEANIYGVPAENLEGSGPSVVFLNGVIASLAVTQFVQIVTRMSPAPRRLNYTGHLSRITSSAPDEECHICTNVKGRKHEADVERYLRFFHAN